MAEIKYLRILYRKIKFDRLKNKDIKKKLNEKRIVERINRQKPIWYGHIVINKNRTG